MWIILFNAVDDFGIRELNGSPSPPPNAAAIDALMKKVSVEAQHGALRIAGLVSNLRVRFYDVLPHVFMNSRPAF